MLSINCLLIPLILFIILGAINPFDAMPLEKPLKEKQFRSVGRQIDFVYAGKKTQVSIRYYNVY